MFINLRDYYKVRIIDLILKTYYNVIYCAWSNKNKISIDTLRIFGILYLAWRKTVLLGYIPQLINQVMVAWDISRGRLLQN